jgi:hypothetical protein
MGFVWEGVDRKLNLHWAFAGRMVMVGLLVADRYQFTTFRGNQPIVSQALPTLDLTVERVLARGK